MVQDTRTTTANPTEAAALREQMVQQLLDEGVLVDPEIEAAFRAVPREVFAPPGTPAELPYAVHDVVRTRFGDDGESLSSLSAPYVQAGNLRQARVEPGMRVLEIGSGGPLASMLAHLVGPTGRVVTVDIDEGVTARARAGLVETGLGERVEVVTADAASHLGRGMFDRIIVTVAAWTVPPVWLDQLVPGGILVVPLVFAPGTQRILSFRSGGDHLVAEEVVTGNFVPMQGGDMYHHPTRVLTGPSGGPVTFRFAEQVPADFAVSDEVLALEPQTAWTGVLYTRGEIWVDLFLWLMLSLPAAGQIKAENKSDIGHDGAFLAGTVEGASFAMFTRRRLEDGTGAEVGAVGKGAHAAALTQRMVDAVRAYDVRHRRGEARFEWWPGSGAVPGAASATHVLRRPHGALVVRWPDATPAEATP